MTKKTRKNRQRGVKRGITGREDDIQDRKASFGADFPEALKKGKGGRMTDRDEGRQAGGRVAQGMHGTHSGPGKPPGWVERRLY